MSLSNKTEYLRGLAEGLKLNPETNEGKLFAVIIETLSVMAEEIDSLGENALDLSEEIDAVSEQLSEIEDIIFENNEDEDDDCDCCGHSHFHDDLDDDDEFGYEVTCPKCGEEIEIEEFDLEEGEIKCPNCGEKLEFDFEEIIGDDDEDA